jgi:hypothetical protein
MGLCGKDPTKAPGCCPTILKELNPCQTQYQAVDPVTGRTVDIPSSLAPTGLHVLFMKACFFAFTIGTFAYTFFEADNKFFYFSKFTNVALTLQCVYHCLSLSTSFCPTIRQPKEAEQVQGRAKWTWYFFNMSVHASILAGVLFWLLDFEFGETTVTLRAILPHGPTAIVGLLDGLLVNRIPVRLFHWWGSVLPLDLCYMGFTLAHAYLNIGNPDTSDNDEGTNDDALYSVVVWKDDFVETLVLFLILILLVGPLVQFFMFLMSLYTWPLCCMSDRRRYTTSASTFAEEKENDEKEKSAEEGSIFASWG